MKSVRINYKISEIADILGVSKEMIRHYEKLQIIIPERIEGNNYRTYSSWDFFTLCEMMQNKEWGISLKKIAEMKSNRYTDSLLERYKETLADLDNTIHVTQLRRKRLQLLIDQIETCRMNIGNYWIEKSRSGYWYEMMEAEGDEFGPIRPYEVPERSIYRSENLVFMDCTFIKKGKRSEWGLYLNDDYVPAVSVSTTEAKYHFSEELCFCSIVDMGDFGVYNEEIPNTVGKELDRKGYVRIGEPRGVILARGVENDAYRRYMKIMIPVKKDETV